MSDIETFVTLKYFPIQATREYLESIPKSVFDLWYTTLYRNTNRFVDRIGTIQHGIEYWSSSEFDFDIIFKTKYLKKLLCQYHERN